MVTHLHQPSIRNGQITLPADVLAELGLSSDDIIILERQGSGEIVLQTPHNPVETTAGIFREYFEADPGDKASDELLETRDRADKEAIIEDYDHDLKASES